MDKITDARALEIITAYGAEPEAWPEAERAACEARIAASPDVFVAALDEARTLDSIVAVDALMPPTPSEALVQSLIASAPAPAASTGNQGLLAKLRDLILPQGQRWPAMAAAASLAIGLAFGLALDTTATGDTLSEDEIVYAAFGFSDYGAGFEELN